MLMRPRKAFLKMPFFYFKTFGTACKPCARLSSYVRFDVLQRILSRMFGVTVIHAMVITDIDDKIIKRSWQVKNQLHV